MTSLSKFYFEHATLLPHQAVREAARLHDLAGTAGAEFAMLAIRHEPEDVHSVRDVLAVLAAGRDRPPNIEAARSRRRVRLIEHAPRRLDLAERLIGHEDRLIVASGIRSEWAQMLPELPTQVLVCELPSEGAATLHPRIAEEAARVQEALALAESSAGLRWIVFFHSLGLMVPESLVERLVGSRSEELVRAAEEQGLGGFLQVVSPVGEPMLRTASEPVALLAAQGHFTDADLVSFVVTLVRLLAASDDPVDRRVIMDVLAGLQRTGRRRAAREALGSALLLQEWWRRLGPREALRWANLCITLDRPRLGLRIIAPALERTETRGTPAGSPALLAAHTGKGDAAVHLRRARARLLHRQALRSKAAADLEAARAAFLSLLEEEEVDPYTELAIARFEATTGAPSGSLLSGGRRRAAEEDPLLRAALGQMLVDTGQPERALELLGEVDLPPADVEAYPAHVLVAGNVAAMAYRSLGRDDDADHLLHAVLHLDPTNLEALLALGTAARQRGDTQVANAWLHRLLQIDPDHERARRMTASEP
jgi:tetratricopeptide (TPR) repeat protein